MANIYVRSTDGSDADDGSTWALAKATITGATAIDAAGDTVFISQSHSQSQAGALTFSIAGTRASPSRLLCGNDAAEPPTALATGAIATITGASAFDSSFSGYFYAYGIEFRAGSGAVNAGFNLGSINSDQTFEDCVFYFVTTGTSGSRTLNNLRLIRPTFRFSAAGQFFLISNKTAIEGGLVHASSTSPTTLFQLQGAAQSSIRGFDFTNLSSSFNLFSSFSYYKCNVIDCKLPASWTGGLVSAALTQPQARVALYNCDSGDTNYKLRIAACYGEISDETTLVRSGGASDGVTGIAWKFVTNADAEFSLNTLDSDEIVRWNETTGSSITVTVEILHDSVTNLKDDEIWLEVEYLGTSGVPLGSFVDDAKADVLATAADQATSSVTWTTTGMSNPNKQKLSVTFTPQEKGFIHTTVKLAKASYTVYVCPKLDVS